MGPFTNAMAPEMRLHVTMMRAIQSRAPTFSSRRHPPGSTPAPNGSIQRRRQRLASYLELTYLRAAFRNTGFIYLCAQKPSLFVASLGASSYSPHAMV